MKKLLAVIMCMFMLISLIPFSVSAAEKVVYVKDGGMGDGTTAEKAVGSIREAVEAVGTKGGTIVVCGLTTIADAHKDFAPWEGLITFTMMYNGVDYRASGAELYYTGQHRTFMAGPTKFENFTFHIAQTMLLCAQWNPIEMGEGVTVNQHTAGKGIYLVAGTQNGDEGDYAFRDRNTHVVVRSGKFYVVSGYGRGISDTFTGNSLVEIYGGEVTYLLGGPVNNGIIEGHATVNVYGGKIATLGNLTDSYSQNAVLGLGSSTVNVYGGEITEIVATPVGGEAVFNYSDGAQANIVELASGMTKINKVADPVTTTATVTTEAPVDTTAVVTTAGTEVIVTTQASGTPEVTPSTGDNALYILTASIITAAVALVIAKRRNANI